MKINFSQLIHDNTRSDDYVNATKLCKAFCKRWTKYRELPQTQEFLKVINQKTNNRSYFAKKGVGTWVHPLVAIHLAEWLSPEFSVYVKETFRRFVEGDPTLANEIIEKQTDEKVVQKIADRAHAHGQYLRSEFALNYEGKQFAPYVAPMIKSHNNENLEISKGKRSDEFLKSPMKKDVMTAMQLLQSAKLNRYRKEENGTDPNQAKALGYGVTHDVMNIMGEDYKLPSDFHSMRIEQQRYLVDKIKKAK